MAVELSPRDTQTRVKHEILARYLNTWGGIIASGLKNRKNAYGWHFVYVDCFSFTGKYAGEREDMLTGRATRTIYGSPVIGVRALDKLVTFAQQLGVSIRTNAILIERDKSAFGRLRETLTEIGFGTRLRETMDFHHLADGEVAIVNRDCLTLGDQLVRYTTSGYAWAFYLIDPRGPSGIPYDFVKAIISQDRHDVMINFIYEDLLRKTGLCIKDDISPQHQRLVDHWTAAFGSDRWIDLARQTLAEIGDHKYRQDYVFEGTPLDDMDESDLKTDEQLKQEKERRFVSAYRDVLRGMDAQVVTKLVDLRFSDKERTMFYLFLTTHDPTGALWLNKILYDAKYLEYELRYRFDVAKRTAPPQGQMSLLQVDPVVPKPASLPRPTTEEIAALILQKLAGHTLKKRAVYRELVDEPFFPGEVDKALNLLKRNGMADFREPLSHEDQVSLIKL